MTVHCGEAEGLGSWTRSAPFRQRDLEQVGLRGWDPAELPCGAQIVAVGPVLDDDAVFHFEPVGLGHLEGLVRRREDRVDRAVVGRAPALFLSVWFGDGLLYAVDGEGVDAVVQVAASVGDVGSAGQSVGVECQIAETRQSPRRGTGALLGVVFPE